MLYLQLSIIRTSTRQSAKGGVQRMSVLKWGDGQLPVLSGISVKGVNSVLMESNLIQTVPQTLPAPMNQIPSTPIRSAMRDGGQNQDAGDLAEVVVAEVVVAEVVVAEVAEVVDFSRESGEGRGTSRPAPPSSIESGWDPEPGWDPDPTDPDPTCAQLCQSAQSDQHDVASKMGWSVACHWDPCKGCKECIDGKQFDTNSPSNTPRANEPDPEYSHPVSDAGRGPESGEWGGGGGGGGGGGRWAHNREGREEEKSQWL